MNDWECDCCGIPSHTDGLFLCEWCRRVEQEARGDLSTETMYAAAIRLVRSYM